MIEHRCLIVICLILFNVLNLSAQKLIPFKLPDSGQYRSFTNTEGEDSDYFINTPSLKDNGDGTVTDYNTGLMWQKSDCGEMTFENAITYCNNLIFADYSDWRLPNGLELFSINQYDYVNPALNPKYFSKSSAEYWWTSDISVDNPNKIWVVNSGGGIGNHLKTETKSAGGNKAFHVRAVRSIFSRVFNTEHFTDLGNETIKDNYTGLIWQKNPSVDSLTWEDALKNAASLNLNNKNDWRVPNIKEIQSLCDPKLIRPAINRTYFNNIKGNFWSSTTMTNNSEVAWDLNTDFGIVSYNEKTKKNFVIYVRGGNDNTDVNFKEVKILGGE